MLPIADQRDLPYRWAGGVPDFEIGENVEDFMDDILDEDVEDFDEDVEEECPEDVEEEWPTLEENGGGIWVLKKEQPRKQ